VRTRELVEGGDLGRIVSAYVMYNIHHPEEVAKRYPGVVRQILTHHSYILLYLVGKPVELCAMKATLHYKEYPEEDIAMVQLRLGAQPLSTLDDAITAQTMIEAAEESIRSRSVVKM